MVRDCRCLLALLSLGIRTILSVSFVCKGNYCNTINAPGFTVSLTASSLEIAHAPCALGRIVTLHCLFIEQNRNVVRQSDFGEAFLTFV